MAWLKLIPLGLLMMASSAFAEMRAYKYQIIPSLGVSQSCQHEGEEELSQVRFYIDTDDLASNQDIVTARVRFSVCLWGGGLIKESYDLKVPRFMFAQAAPMQGTFNLKNPLFSKISVSEMKVNNWQVRYFDKSGQIWTKMDPIEIQMNAKKSYPEKIRFYVKDKKKWIETKLRLVEKQ